MSEFTLPRISVVVPIYNVEAYLDKCVASLVSQSYPNLEILLVDDGSPDGCPALCDEWAEKDPRVVVIHKENGGLSDARNTGIARASGEYISFVDSDDYVAEKYIETLYRTLREQDADVSACNYRQVDEEGAPLPEKLSEKLQTGVCTGEEMLHRYFSFDGTGKTLVIACAKLFKKSLFSEVSFATGRLHEDEYLYFPLYRLVGKVAFTDAFLYSYVQRKGSIINSTVSSKRAEDICGFWEERLALYPENTDLYKKISAQYALCIFGILDRVEDKALASRLSRIYRKRIRYARFSCVDLPPHFKIAYLLIALAPRTAAILIHRR